MRSFVHYFLAAIILTVYGLQVCPFIESLGAVTLSLIVGGFLAFFFCLRVLLVKLLILSSPPLSRTRRQFGLELAVLVSAGLSMTFFNMINYDFPLGSGLKLVIGCLALGLFEATDVSLARERAVARELEQDETICFVSSDIFPLTKKFAFIASALALLANGILILVLLHDLNWINNLAGDEPLTPATRAVILEVSFVMSLLLAYSVNLIMSYARNLKLYFDRQTRVLEEVSNGRLSGHVPISTNDEFALIAQYTNRMIAGLRERTEALQKNQDVTIRALASLAETRDNETGRHIIRTQYYMKALAENLRNHPDYRDALTEEAIDLMFKSAPLHDVGKVGVPDRILLKPGKLTAEEFEEMKKHTIYGRETLHQAEMELGKDSFLRYATEIAYTHHEKWDGSGYPRGLKGEDIPISGRLMAVADVYDALISKRVYKPPFSHDKACSIILEGKGAHFDPQVIEAFINCEEEFKRIASEHADRQEETQA